MARGAVLLAVLAATAGGCGGDDEQATRTAPPAAKEPGAITIARPAAGDRLRAREDGGRLGAEPLVKGTADPGAEVVVNGGCSVQGCVGRGTADEEGRWEARVRLEARAGEPEVRITAYYRGSVVGPEDRVEVRLAGPRPEPVSDRGGGRGGGGAGGRGSGGGGGGGGPAVPPESLDPQPVPGPGPSGGGGSGTLVLIGDSLAEGIEPLLPRELPGWRITSDALTSRPLAAGMGILARTRVPDGAVVAMSLFTNDDPSRIAALEAAVRTSVRRAGPRGCAVWATIARPPFGGRSYAAANALLLRLDAALGRRLAVVPWAELAGRSGWLAADRVHANPTGYRARARLYAQAARSCG